MAERPVRWSDDIDDVITGDITAALACVTPAGGTVLTPVAPCGIDRRDTGMVGFTTSLGFAKKLERIVRDPQVALAYHSREHGFSTSPRYLLVQGMASVDLQPSRERLQAFVPQAERYLGEAKRGPVWDRLLRDYYFERVFVDVAVERIVAWAYLGCSGDPEVIGAAPAEPPAPQSPPKNGTRPRIDVTKAAGRVAALPHRLLGYRGADGFPAVVPVEVAGHDSAGLRLVRTKGLLPAGGRRAGFLAHAYRPHLVGLTTRTFTGWLEVDNDGAAVYAPHTFKGFVAPPNKNLLLLTNGLFAKFGMWQARRKQVARTLERLAAENASAASTRPSTSD